MLHSDRHVGEDECLQDLYRQEFQDYNNVKDRLLNVLDMVHPKVIRSTLVAFLGLDA